MLKVKNMKVVDSYDFDQLVQETYGKIYCFQQQDGCKDRGVHHFSVPSKWTNDKNMSDQIPYKINGSKMGVKFKVWLETTTEDINAKMPELYPGANSLFWERNFYPDFYTLVNDLHKRGLIEEGDYMMEIDW